MINQKGQAVLVVLLSMAIALTVVLSILGSTTSDIKVGTNETQSQRAFSAAESGIEQALLTKGNASGTLQDNISSYNATLVGLAKGQFDFSYPSDIISGDSAILWFVSHTANGTFDCASNPCYNGRFFDIYWGKQGSDPNQSTTPAIEISVYYLLNPGVYTSASIRVSQAVYDPNSSRRVSNSYAAPAPASPCPCTVGTTTYAFGTLIDLFVMGVPVDPLATPPNSVTYNYGPLFMVVKMIYNTVTPQPVAFHTDKTLPSQGSQVDSTGNLNNATYRKIEVLKPFSGAPPIFDAAVYSPGGLSL